MGLESKQASKHAIARVAERSATISLGYCLGHACFVLRGASKRVSERASE